MIEGYEKIRVELQTRLDSEKTIEERRVLGQFSTPTRLAKEIVEYAVSLCPDKIKFMDPAFGTGSFYSSLVSVAGEHIEWASGFEIDKHYYAPTSELWSHNNLRLINSDFLLEDPDQQCNLLICNPPYTRHHLIPSEYKVVLHNKILNEMSLETSGLSGMYCYYMLSCHKWLEPGALSAWLIPSEFMDVVYGKAIKDYLLNKVTLLRIHRYDPEDVQFDDALVSSAVVWLRNEVPKEDVDVIFSYGGTHQNPNIIRKVSRGMLENEGKWTRFPIKEERDRSEVIPLATYFSVKRGIATGDNDYFIMERAKAEELGIPDCYLVPILPSPRKMKEDIILSNEDGYPSNIIQLVLLNCRDDENNILEYSEETYRYLKKGEGEVASRYLCRKRKMWYLQEQRVAAPIICSYMGRGKGNPFRFILNKSDAIVTNSYMMLYPTDLFCSTYGCTDESMHKAWSYLNYNVGKLLDEGRVYGGGLQKIEPKELMSVDATDFDEYMKSVQK